VHVKKCTVGKKSKNTMEKPRQRAANRSLYNNLRNPNHNEIVQGISLRSKTPLGWPEASISTGLRGAIPSTSRIRLGYSNAVAKTQRVERSRMCFGTLDRA